MAGQEERPARKSGREDNTSELIVLVVMGLLGIYVHVPFCTAICNYCNFNRGLFDEALKSSYVIALQEEIVQMGDGAQVDTIYFGGGTPSLLKPVEVAGIINSCRDSFDLNQDIEITLEANPETIDADQLDGFRDVGVNRLSMGVQSFHNEELHRLGRLHNADCARKAYSLARAAGFDNISLDLMMALPQQTMTTWKKSIESLVELGPDHASLYLLELYPNAPLRDEMTNNGWSLTSDEDAAGMYLWALGWLEQEGYKQYEISNISRLGKYSRHNLKYWTDGEWLGFGCGAHSTRAGVRWRNVAGTKDYIGRVRDGGDLVVERRILSEAERIGDVLFMGLRLVEGVDIGAVESRYRINIQQRYGEALEPFVEAGLLREGGSRLQLTRRGMLLSNEIMGVFV